MGCMELGGNGAYTGTHIWNGVFFERSEQQQHFSLIASIPPFYSIDTPLGLVYIAFWISNSHRTLNSGFTHSSSRSTFFKSHRGQPAVTNTERLLSRFLKWQRERANTFSVFV